MQVEFSHQLAKVRFQHRVTELPDGKLAYRLSDGTGYVRLTKSEWHDVGTFFNESVAPSKRRATVEMLLWIPGYVLFIAIAGAIIPKEFARALPNWLYSLIFLGPLFATPFVIYLRHSFHVKRVSDAIDATFARRPPTSVPQREPWRPPFWLDVLGLLFVGPHLIVSVIGELDPDFFRNTPFTGSRLDALAVFGFALIVVRVVWSATARMASQPPQASR